VQNLTAVSDRRLMVAHARILLRIELLKNLFFCMIQGSCVPNLGKTGPYITSQSCPQTQDGRTDGRLRDLYILSNAYALHWTSFGAPRSPPVFPPSHRCILKTMPSRDVPAEIKLPLLTCLLVVIYVQVLGISHLSRDLKNCDEFIRRHVTSTTCA